MHAASALFFDSVLSLSYILFYFSFLFFRIQVTIVTGMMIENGGDLRCSTNFCFLSQRRPAYLDRSNIDKASLMWYNDRRIRGAF